VYRWYFESEFKLNSTSNSLTEFYVPVGKFLVLCMQCIYELIQNGANFDMTNSNGETALHLMIRSNKFECVIGLLAKGANAAVMGTNGDNALHLAVEVILFHISVYKCIRLKAGIPRIMCI